MSGTPPTVVQANGNVERLADAVERISRGFSGRPAPQPPSCFSELARLNACYDDVATMKAVLTRVMTDLIKEDPSIAEAMIAAINKAGSSIPLIGVTDGSNAQPGQVGEYLEYLLQPSFATGTSQQFISATVLPPGDWSVQAAFATSVVITSAVFTLDPVPVGVTNAMSGEGAVSAGVELAWIIGVPARASITVPTLFAFNLAIGAPSAGTGYFLFQAWRRR